MYALMDRLLPDDSDLCVCSDMEEKEEAKKVSKSRSNAMAR